MPATLSDPFDLESLRKERRIPEFVHWVESVLEETRDRDDLKATILLKKGHAKEFYEEIFPVWRWVKGGWLVREPGRIRFLIDDKSIDAILTLERIEGEIQHQIECVHAIDGQDDRLRMEHLLLHGSVSLTAPLRATNTKASGRRKIIAASDAMMKAVDDSAREQMELFGKCLRRKFEKGYPRGTWLVCSFDDHLLRACRHRLPKLPELVADLLSEFDHPFSRVIIVGMSGDIHLEWKEARP